MNTNDDFWYDENCPCNGCPSEGACTVEKLACEDFRHYMETGERWDVDRWPSAALYHELFPDILSEEGDPEDA
ncbi:MAG: hypothetical protein ACYDCX_12140 [Acidithiobacillus sp.]|uniref:hypothetical protein n=1 Tax=Acidithiobacillus ferrooxidans TaxID=920 RepID=UPI001C06950A|nr:hypothetical protein [Acidithiobacillus ferrooxidans]MBU2862017.1 hypothetical protein [Acidithiobacillus ferrooxidans]